MDWKKLLADPGGEAFFRLSGPPDELAAAEEAARELGFFIARIDGAAIPDKEALLRRLASQLNFPDYFGLNWDSLADCLSDLGDWLDAPGYLIVFTDSGKLCGGKREDLAVLADVLRSAARFWGGRIPPRAFKAVMAA